jgi:hypothetical protein
VAPVHYSQVNHSCSGTALLHTKYFRDDEMKKNEMMRAYGMNQKYKRCCRVSVKNMKGRDHFKDLGIDGSIILKWGDIICICHTPDSNQWQALMNAVIKL